jgi:hypothetical protein
MGGQTTETGKPLPDQESSTGDSTIEQEPGSEEEPESEEEPTEEEEEPTEEEEKPTDDEELTEGEPITWGEPTWEQSTFEEPVSEEQQTPEEPATWEKPISEEEPTSEQPATLEEPTLKEPPSTPPLPQYGTKPNPSSNSVHRLLASSTGLPGPARQGTGSGSDPEESELLPEITPHVGVIQVSSRSKDIFKHKIHLPHPKIPGGRITVKLPDFRGRNLYPPLPSSTRPPIQMAPNVSSTTIPATSKPGPAPILHLQAAPTPHRYLGFDASTVAPRHAFAGANQASSADSWPTGIRFEFKVSQPESMPRPESTHVRPQKLSLFDFNHGVFNDFTTPSAAKMHLPGFASAMPFTPPASADNTPLKQPSGKTPDRPSSPSDG